MFYLKLDKGYIHVIDAPKQKFAIVDDPKNASHYKKAEEAFIMMHAVKEAREEARVVELIKVGSRYVEC